MLPAAESLASVCEFPARLHPVSEVFLHAWLRGDMSTGQFQRYFSLPNSDYIALAECLVQSLDT